MSKKRMFLSLVVCVFLSLFCVNGVYAKRFLNLPFEGSFTRTSCFGCYPGHTGNDWGMQNGTPIFASADGLVTAFPDPHKPPSLGNHIEIDHSDGWVTICAHLSSFAIGIVAGAEPVPVYRGQIIGYSGNTGGPWKQDDDSYKSAYHLHFEVQHNGVPVDPYNKNDYLWLTDPPSHGVYNCFSFDFPNGSSQGFSCGFDTKEAREPQYSEWRVHVVNNPPTTNPGVKSPEYASGMMAKGTVIKFNAKVIGNDVPVNAKLYIKHKDDNWNNVVPIGTIGTDHAYHTWLRGSLPLGDSRAII